MHKPYSEIQILSKNFTINCYNWQGKVEPKRTIKQRATGALELVEISAMHVDIGKLTIRRLRWKWVRHIRCSMFNKWLHVIKFVEMVTRVANAQ